MTSTDPLPDVILPDVILIGPIRSGKSTLGRRLAEALGVPQVSLDALCWDYYREIGFGAPGVMGQGPDGMIVPRFHLHALERLLAEHRECVIDLGAGHSFFEDADDLERAQRVLAPYPNVFLLLPSPDPETSSAVLAERNRDNEWLQSFTRHSGGKNPNERFLRHPANAALARHVVYTEGRTPEETRDQILALLAPRPREWGLHTRTRLKSEMVRHLSEAREAAQSGRLRSLVLITALWDGAGAECWSRIGEEDQAEVCDHLAALRQDMGCQE